MPEATPDLRPRAWLASRAFRLPRSGVPDAPLRRGESMHPYSFPSASLQPADASLPAGTRRDDPGGISSSEPEVRGTTRARVASTRDRVPNFIPTNRRTGRDRADAADAKPHVSALLRDAANTRRRTTRFLRVRPRFNGWWSPAASLACTFPSSVVRPPGRLENGSSLQIPMTAGPFASGVACTTATVDLPIESARPN